MSTTNEVISSKRRKTTTNIRINDLPEGILTKVASYLATPSVVMFSIAVTQDGASPTQTSNAIIFAAARGEQQQLNVLDFGDIDKTLAVKLTDDHITTILTHIDAPNNLKTLKLAGCVNITGSCLDVIRSSAVLELLELSLVNMHESPVLDPEPLLSESIVIPILDSLLVGRTLKLLHLPKKFRVNVSQEMNRFVDRYNEYLSSFQFKCSKCEVLCSSTGAERWMFRDVVEEYEGVQNYTCSRCLLHFCIDGYGTDCIDDDENEYIEWCHSCEKHYCKECVPSNKCGLCGEDYCNNCNALEKVCGECELNVCNECILEYRCTFCDRNETICPDCTRSHKCYRGGCNKVICAECVESKGEGGGTCEECIKAFCSSERQYLHCNEDWEKACSKCTQSTATYFRSKCQEYKKENEQLCKRMEDLYKKYMNVEKE